MGGGRGDGGYGNEHCGGMMRMTVEVGVGIRRLGEEGCDDEEGNGDQGVGMRSVRGTKM